MQTKPRGDRARYLKLARTNAATALTTKLSQQSTIHQRLQALASVLELPAVKRMECFDISHTMGEQTVASCVVFDSNGPLRAEYRRYNIAGITPVSYTHLDVYKRQEHARSTLCKTMRGYASQRQDENRRNRFAPSPSAPSI